MTAKSKSTNRVSRKPRSNLAKSGAHMIAKAEYDEIPELSDEFFDRAVMSKGLTVLPVRKPRGRPMKPDAKVHQGLRLSPDVLEAFRATGPKWQARIDAALREWLTSRRMLKRRNQNRSL